MLNGADKEPHAPEKEDPASDFSYFGGTGSPCWRSWLYGIVREFFNDYYQACRSHSSH
jgi:hypothetical protein